MPLLAANATAFCTSLLDLTMTTAAGVELSNRLLKRLFAAAYSALDGRTTGPSTAPSRACQSGWRAGPEVEGGACRSGVVFPHEPNAPAATVPSAPRMKA